MRRLVSVLALLACLGCALGQTVRVEATVVDAQTGEPLPYASVGVPGGPATVTNHEGQFVLDTEEGEKIAVTYVGYEKGVVEARRVGRKIALKPYVRQLTGVEVKGEKGFLSRIAKHCEASLRRNSDVRSNFFYRALTRNNGLNSELTEAFFDGQCAYGLRNLKLVNGRSASLEPHRQAGPTILNYHLSMQVMPVAKQPDALGYSVPLVRNAPNGYLQRYDISYDRLVGADSSLIYLLHYKAREGVKGSIVEGDLYVDGKTLDLLRLEGQVKGAFLTSKMADGSTVEMRQDLGLTVCYTTRQGFSEVEEAATVAKTTYPDGTVSVSRAIMFNMGKKHFKGKKRLREQGNLRKAIEEQGTDSLFWEKNVIVKRTLDEEQAVKSLAALRLKQTATTGETNGHGRPSARQTLLNMAANIRAFNAYYPQEDIYIHTDHDGYMPGETMWLSAVVQRSDSHRPTNLSRVMHLQLLDPRGKKVMDRRYDLDEGYLDTGVALPKNLREGTYTLRAYTHHQLNWGLSDVYERQIDIRREPTGEQTPPTTHAAPHTAPHTPTPDGTDNAAGDTLLLLLTHSGNVVAQRIVTGDSLAPLARQWANGQDLQPGHNRVAAIDTTGTLRMDTVACRPMEWQQPNCEVVGPKDGLKPYCKVRLRLKGEAKTSYLLCVTDAERDFGPQQTPYRQWLMERTLRHADGTLRHDLKTMGGRQRFVKKHLPETDEHVRGRVVDEQGQPVADVKLVVRQPGHEQTVKTGRQGLFAANMRRLGRDGRDIPVSLWVASAKQRKRLFIQLFHAPQPYPDTTTIDCNRALDLLLEGNSRTDGKARDALDIPTLDAWLPSYDADFSLSTELTPGGTLQQRLTCRNRPVVWVVDGKVEAEPPMMNEALTLAIRKDNVDVARYQLPPEMNSRRPVLISVTTSRSWGADKYRARHIHYATLSPQYNFSFPLYGDDLPDSDTRRTLYWNPVVNTDEQGEAVVEFSNNGSCRRLNIRVE